MKMYIMQVSELLAKPNLIHILAQLDAFESEWDHSNPKLFWNEYHFVTDGANWYFHRQYYASGGLTMYPCSIKITGGKYIHPEIRDYTYEELTELVTSSIEIILNKSII